MGWLTGYGHRKSVTITGQTGAGTLYQVDLSIAETAGGDFTLDSHALSFPNDIRFTDNDETTELDYWIEDITVDPITVWVEVADSLESNADIYCYYGKSGDTTTSNSLTTFLGFGTGGTITTDDGDRIHSFLSDGTFTPDRSMNVEVLVVAGGGGGGFHVAGVGGGGGAGGLLYDASHAITSQGYSITVGGGGAADTAGTNSIFNTITSSGGGKGGTYLDIPGGAGGSGGGGGQDGSAGGAGTAGQGNDGGPSTGGYVQSAGGGGGGAGAVGGGSYDTLNARGGAGGIGIQSSITGAATYYAGGGGGATHNSLSGASPGGLGGGGAGYSGATHILGISGTVNTGGGGGGGGENYAAGIGGSGIVITRYEYRKYASPEPAFSSAGAEENVPTAIPVFMHHYSNMRET